MENCNECNCEVKYIQNVLLQKYSKNILCKKLTTNHKSLFTFELLFYFTSISIFTYYNYYKNKNLKILN